MLPTPHPDPPTDLPRRTLPIETFTLTWVRSHDRAYGPFHFGRSGKNRFDAPGGEYGILYIAADAHGAFVKTFGREPGRTLIDWDELNARNFSEIASSRPLRLTDISGAGLARIGADARLSTGDYSVSQIRALALHRHPEQPDGLLYRSRHGPSRLCAALFDRAEHALTATSLGLLTHPRHAALLANILDTYGYSLIGP